MARPDPSKAEAGVWSYYFRFSPVAVRSGFHASLEVLGHVIDQDASVSVAFWTEVKEKAVVLYASLTSHRRLLPIREGRVMARVFSPDNNAHDIELRDSGTGYPDLTLGDGIYSGYFTTGVTPRPGHYAVVLSADSNEGRATLARPLVNADVSHVSECCGSAFPQFLSIPSQQFSRRASPKSFVLNHRQTKSFFSPDGKLGDDDVFPPNRITDLSMVFSGLNDGVRFGHQLNYILLTFYNQGLE